MMQNQGHKNPALKGVYAHAHGCILNQISLSYISLTDQEHCVKPSRALCETNMYI